MTMLEGKGSRSSAADRDDSTEAIVTRNRRRGRRRPAATSRTRWWSLSVVVGILGFLFAFPTLWMVLSAFKTSSSFVSDAIPLTWRSFFPSAPTIENFVRIFADLGFGRDLTNTVIVSVCQVGLTLIVATLAGYAFGRLRFRGRNLLFAALMIGAFIPVEALVVPMYAIVRDLGLLSSYAGLFLPFAFSAFAIFLMRQSFAGLRRSCSRQPPWTGQGPCASSGTWDCRTCGRRSRAWC